MKVRKVLTFRKLISLLTIGFGIGWLAGLSVSPVVSILISSIVGVTMTLVIIMSGLSIKKSNPSTKSIIPWGVRPEPIALLIFGIVFGSGVGIYVRTHNTLGVSSEEKFVETWKTLGKSSDENPIITEREIVQRLFDKFLIESSNDKGDNNETDLILKPRNNIESHLKSTDNNQNFCDQLKTKNLYYNEDEFIFFVKSSKLNQIEKDGLLEANSSKERKEQVQKTCQ